MSLISIQNIPNNPEKTRLSMRVYKCGTALFFATVGEEFNIDLTYEQAQEYLQILMNAGQIREQDGKSTFPLSVPLFINDKHYQIDFEMAIELTAALVCVVIEFEILTELLKNQKGL